MTTRKTYTPKFKAQVAMEAIRAEKTLRELGSQFKVPPIQIAKWRKTAVDQLPELFVDGRRKSIGNGEVKATALVEEIDRLKVELDWLKKKGWYARLGSVPLMDQMFDLDSNFTLAVRICPPVKDRRQNHCSTFR